MFPGSQIGVSRNRSDGKCGDGFAKVARVVYNSALVPLQEVPNILPGSPHIEVLFENVYFII
jgi:hypothetical protein